MMMRTQRTSKWNKEKMEKKLFIMSLLTIVSYFTGGCFAYDVGIKIIDLKTSKITNLPSKGYREVVIRINPEKQNFYTLQREKGIFKLRIRNYNGKELNQETLPLFSKGYCGSMDYTISPNGKNLIYFSEKNKSLNLYDIPSKRTSILISNFASSSVDLKLMKFISESELIIGIDKNKWQTKCQILKINIISKNSLVIANPENMCGFVSELSPKNKKLAYIDENGIVLLNLSTTENKVIVKSSWLSISNLCWNYNAQKLGYTDGNKIKIIDLTNMKITTVKTFAKKLLCYEIKFIGDKHLLYHLGTGEFSPIHQPLRILYISTGKDVREIKNFMLNGRLYVVANGKVIIGEVGY